MHVNDNLIEKTASGLKVHFWPSAIYNSVFAVTMQMNVTISGYVLFKNLYVNSFVQFAGEDLGNPNKFSELLETSEPERSFKKKVADY